MPNYNNSCIYKIFCKDKEIEDIYIGSTTNFSKRKKSHKNHCNNPNDSHYNIKVYQFIRDNGGWSNWDMIILEEVNCENKLELLKIERKYIEKYNSLLNIEIPLRTQQEWYQKNKDKIAEQSKKYREANRDKLIEISKKYYDANKDKAQKYYEANKDKINERKKEYRQKNKDKIIVRENKYREANKDKISERRKIKIKCECGSEVRKSDISTHKKTKKHQNFIKGNKNNIIL
jgi:hypothetical protein